MSEQQEIQESLNEFVNKICSYERELIIREIQAFASEYAHEMTKDEATRDVVIVEQLLEFLIVPSSEESAQE